MPSIYIAGGMTDVGNNFNFPLFDYVAENLRALGCEVFSPAEHARDKLGPLQEIQHLDKAELKQIVRYRLFAQQLMWICHHATMLFMLPGWEQSPGARAEHALAVALGIEVREAPNIILPEAGQPAFFEAKLLLEDKK